MNTNTNNNNNTNTIPLNLLLTPFYPLYLHILPPLTPLTSHHHHYHTLYHSTIIPLKSTSEDNLYVSDFLFIVSDGIGSWKHHGIDPSIYSKHLCLEISKTITNTTTTTNTPITNLTTYKSLITTSITTLNAHHILGSATFCSLYINIKALKMYSVSLGDTVFAILREDALLVKGSSCKYSVYFKSKEQYHSFNTPFQCGHISNADIACSIDMSFDIKERDVIIIGTDGLWDNISLEHIVEVCNTCCNGKDVTWNDIKDITVTLADEAKMNSQSKVINSPFSKRAKEYGVKYVGGKPDDIAVVVVFIKKGYNDKECSSDKVSTTSNGNTGVGSVDDEDIQHVRHCNSNNDNDNDNDVE